METTIPRARQAYAQVKSGTLRDCSVGFSHAEKRTPTDDETRTYPGVREVIERATLDEVSLVLRGAVPGAEVVSVRQSAGRAGRRAGDSLDERILSALAIVDARY